jgi:hypothetical protein
MNLSYHSSFLVSVPPGQMQSPTASTVNTNIIPQQLSKISRTNRPTVNSLMHLYGPWILDASLLQIKDRSSRSNTNDCKA